MPLYSDPGYYYSTGGGSGLYSNSYSAPYYTTPSTYVGSSYGRPYAIPSLSSYSSSTSSRYQPKLSTITETPLGSRGLIPLTRLNSPKIITTPGYHHHHTSKYIPPRPININTADIDVSASRYRTRDLKSPRSSPKSPSTTQVNESPPITSQNQSSLSSGIEQQCQQTTSSRADQPSNLNRSTIKRNRAVVRLSTVRKSIRDRSIPRSRQKTENESINNDQKKPKIHTSQSINSEKSSKPVSDNLDTSTSSWRDKFGDDLVPKPFGIIKKSPGELLLERYIIPSKFKDEVFVNSIDVPAKSESEKNDDTNREIIIELEPIMQSAIRRLSIPKCPDFQDFCEDISSDKIDDDLNAGELRRRASIIQEQEIELLNQLQKSASGSFQLIHLERNESGSDLNGNRKSTKRKSVTKKPKKVRHKITATVEIQNSALTPILQECLEEDTPTEIEVQIAKPKFTFNVDEIEENHTIQHVFKLPKKKTPKIEEEKEMKMKEQIPKSLEKIELKKGIKNSPKKIKVTKKIDPIKGVKSSPKKNNVEIAKALKEENIITLEENLNQAKTFEQIENEISEIVTELQAKPKEKIAIAKLEINNSKLNEEPETFLNKKDIKDSGNSSLKTPVIKKKPITPKPLEILKSKKSEEITTKSPIKTSSPLANKNFDITSEITPDHFKFDDESIKKSKAQSPTMPVLKSGKLPISPLAIDHNKDDSSPLIARPKPITGKLQKSDSGEDFWNQIGTRETLYMSNRKRNVIETQWEKCETLLDNQTTNDVKNLQEIKSKVHDQKNEALKQADEQNPTGELGRRAHSNESVLCMKKKGLIQENQDSVDDKKITNIDNINETSKLEKSLNKNENLVKINNQLRKSKEIPKKIPDINETLKKLNQPLQLLPTPTDSENSNTTITPTTTTKSSEQKQQDTTSNIPKIATGLKAKSPEIKCKEIDLNKNKLDPQKTAPPSPEVVLSVSTIKSDVATIPTTTVATNNLQLSESKNKSDNSKINNRKNDIKVSEKLQNSNIEDNKISPKLTTKSIVNNDEIVNKLNDDKTINESVGLVAEQHESKEKSTTTTTSSFSPAALITDNNEKQKKISPPTTLKTPQLSPVIDKLSTNITNDIKISSTIDNKNKKPIKDFEKIGKIPDKKICDANSIDKIIEKITNNNEENIIKEIENHHNHQSHHQQQNENINENENNVENQVKIEDDEKNNENQQQINIEHQLSCKNVLMKFATVSNLNQCLLDVDADIEDIKSDIDEDSEEDSSYNSYLSDNNKNLSESMKRKDKKHKNNKQQKPKEEKQFNRNKIKLDHTKKCYVKDEAPPYPLIATPRPLWKPEKFIIPESDTDDSDTDNSDNDGDNNNDGSDNNSSDNDSSTSSGSSDDEYDDELNPNKKNNNNNNIIRMSTCSNDSGFEGGTAPSSPKKMLGAEARDSPSTPPSHNPAYKIESNNDEVDETSYTYAQFQKSGRITAPATNIPRFKKYSVEDFHFLTVLGKGSFGKVLLAELRNTDYYYAVKCLKKDVVLEDDDVECTLIERKVLALGTKHPYLCHLFCTFQTESHLFFVMEYLNGGDLMFHIQQTGRFPEPRARFYAAEIISGLKFLHKKGIIYRDLKLDNVLLDFDGHVRIADFGMCKLQIYLDKTADSFCGTPDYMAPEIIKGDNYNQNVDWWSFGVLLYEMLIGQSPFSGCDEEYLFWSICNEMPLYPLMLSQESTSLLKALLEKDSSKRIGSQYSPAGDIYSHPFFNQIEWDRLEKRQIEPPFKPQVKHPLDTQYFDKTFTRERVRLTPIDKDILQSMDQAQFQGFSYTNPNATLE